MSELINTLPGLIYEEVKLYLFTRPILTERLFSYLPNRKYFTQTVVTFWCQRSGIRHLSQEDPAILTLPRRETMDQTLKPRRSPRNVKSVYLNNRTRTQEDSSQRSEGLFHGFHEEVIPPEETIEAVNRTKTGNDGTTNSHGDSHTDKSTGASLNDGVKNVIGDVVKEAMEGLAATLTHAMKDTLKGLTEIECSRDGTSMHCRLEAGNREEKNEHTRQRQKRA